MAKVFFTTLLFLLLSPGVAKAQVAAVTFSHITVDNGLSQSIVHCALQDKSGLIWIGTDDGLNCYNGYDFKIYKNDFNDKHSLSSNCILSMYEDRKGDLWIGTLEGLCLYDRRNDRFIKIPNWPTSLVRSITEDNFQNLWAVTTDQLVSLDKTRQIITLFGSHPDLEKADYRFRVVYTSDKNKIWIGTLKNGLLLYETNTRQFTKFTHNSSDPNSISGGAVIAILDDRQGRLWIGTETGLDLLEIHEEQPLKSVFRHFQNNPDNPGSLSAGSVLSLIADDKDQLWVGTENGGLNSLDLNLLNKGVIRFKHFVNDPDDPSSISNNSIQSLFQDAQKNIWIGTYGKGIDLICPYFEKFMLFRPEPLKNSLSNMHVNVFFEDGDYIWIGTEGGLDRFNKKDKTFKHFVHNPHDPRSLSSNAVWAIEKEKEGLLWIGTWAGGLGLFNCAEGTFTHYGNNSGKNNDLNISNIFALSKDSKGKLWIGTIGGGLSVFDPQTGKFSNFSQANSKISGNYIPAMVETPDGILWFVNVNSIGQGVECYSPTENRFEQYYNNFGMENGLKGKIIHCLFVDSRGKLWVGTDGGINLFNRKTKTFINYDKEDGLPDNSVKSIIEDGAGNFWIGTNKGLSKFISAVQLPGKPVFKNYTIADGLQSTEFNPRSCYRDSRGYLYFGGINGFNIFHPDSITDNAYVPQVLITDFLLFNKPVDLESKDSPLKENIICAKEMSLKYDQSVITFKFAALNFVKPEKNQYAYKMEGFEKEWNYVGYKREATYTNLNPGEYLFRVKASNNDGVWNEQGIALHIVVLPPWWRTLVFKIAVIFLILSVASGIYFIRISRLNRQKRHLEDQVKQRTREVNEKNGELMQTAEELNEINTLLEERQQFIEEQAEEIKTHNEWLQKINTESQVQAVILEQTNQKLTLSNATKDRLLSIIAHDLKNPFSTILNFTEILSKNFEKLTEEKKHKFIQAVHDSSQNVYDLLENLLQWASMQTHSITPYAEAFDISELLHSNSALMKNTMEEKEIALEINAEGNIPIFADRNMINTVVRNLLGNAIKYTEKGKISLSVTLQDHFIQVKIIDSGVGIPNAKLQYIFEIDKKKTTPGTKGEKGSGLGLLICREFIQMNGGEITVESTEGKGTTFAFTVPSGTR
jgi:signal transduction histidine kinase/ligand-binding sensor domain-containing protein